MTDLASLADLVRRAWAEPSGAPAARPGDGAAWAAAPDDRSARLRHGATASAPNSRTGSSSTPHGPAARLLLIDGPSGSGKSTLADGLHASLSDTGAILIRMDEIYPGWSGLEQATTILARDVLAPWRHGEPSGHALWDWAVDAPAGWRDIPPGHPLIVEGCGAASGWADDPATVLAWVEASDETRKRRALDRDAGTFDAHWEMWDAQWRRYLARADYRARADAVIRTD
jgi:hypothetical protein